MKKHIPNFITLLNLLSGCIAVIYVVKGDLLTATLFVFIGILMDFLDGLVARLLNAQSELGIQLDSLSDMVTSGVVPGLFLFQLISQTIPNQTQNQNANWEIGNSIYYFSTELPVFPLIGLLFPLAAAYRLARFNVDEDQQQYFKGLPVPLATLVVVAIPLMKVFQEDFFLTNLLSHTSVLVLLTLVLSILMNSPLKLFALKFKTFSWRSNKEKYIFLITLFLWIGLFKFASIFFILFTYLFLSLFFPIKKNN